MKSLSPQQISHAAQCLNLFNKTALDKYADGQKYHGGNMWEKPGMAHEAYMEVVDLMFYISTIGNQIDLALKFLREGHLDKCEGMLVNMTKQAISLEQHPKEIV